MPAAAAASSRPVRALNKTLNASAREIVRLPPGAMSVNRHRRVHRAVAHREQIVV